MVKPMYKRQKLTILTKGAQVQLGKKDPKPKGKGPFATIVARHITLQTRAGGAVPSDKMPPGKKAAEFEGGLRQMQPLAIGLSASSWLC